jgi:RNA polymerase sigma-70 factor, ECF subfamily
MSMPPAVGLGLESCQPGLVSYLHEPPDWEEIELLYRRLEQLTASPVVTMNRAIAAAEVDGPAAALALHDSLELDDYRYFHSTRADLLRRLGRADEARAAYERAVELAQTEVERRFLEVRPVELER